MLTNKYTPRRNPKCEIRRNDLLAGVRIKFSCHEPATVKCDLGEDCPLRLCPEHAQSFRQAHPEIKVDRLK